MIPDVPCSLGQDSKDERGKGGHALRVEAVALAGDADTGKELETKTAFSLSKELSCLEEPWTGVNWGWGSSRHPFESH